MAYDKRKLYQLNLFFTMLLGMIIFLFYLFISNYYLSIENTKKELKGINIIAVLQDFMIEIQEIRGLDGIRQKVKNGKIDDEIDKNIKKIELNIEYLKSINAFDGDCERTIGGFFKTTMQKEIAPDEKFEKYTTAIYQLNRKMHKLKTDYHLSFDSDMDSYHIISIMINYTTDMIEAVAKTRGLVSSNLNDGKEIKKYIDEINNNRYQFKNSSKKIKEIIENLKKEDELHVLNAHIIDIDVEYDSYADLTEQIINSKKEVDPYEYFLIGTELIKNSYDFYFMNREFLGKRFHQRYNDLKKIAIYGTFAAAGSLLLSVLIWIYMIRNIKRFLENEMMEKEELMYTDELKNSLLECKNVHEVCTSALNILAKRFSAVQGVIYLYKKTNARFYLGKSYSVSINQLEHVLEFDDGLIGQAAVEQREIYTDISDLSGLLSEYQQEPGSKLNPNCIYTAPLFANKELVAVIQMMFLDTDIRLKEKKIGRYNDIIATFISNQQAKEINEKYITLIDKNIIISTFNELGEIINVSKAFEKISGYKKSDVIGKKYNLIIHPDVEESMYEEIWSKLHQDEIWKGEVKNRTKDGKYFWVDMTIWQDKDLYGNILGHTMIQNDITDKKLLERLSTLDSLTGLYNRRSFDTIFTQQHNMVKRDRKNMAFLIIDIDNFKEYNDTYGHQEGDEALISVAGAMKNAMKRACDYLFRLGGEEFGALYMCDTLDHAKEIAEKLRSNVEALKIEHKKSTALECMTISIGLVLIRHDSGQGLKEIYKAADDALYRAKEAGRNRVEVYEAKMAQNP